MSCDSASATQLVKTLRMNLRGAEPAAIELELLNTFREFCVRTNAWTVHISFPIVPSQRNYVLYSPDPRAEISTLISVDVDGRPISGWAGDYLPRDNDNIGGFIANGEDRIDKSLNLLTLQASYDSGVNLNVAVALRPKVKDADQELYIPDQLGFDFFDILRTGCAARMQEHDGRPYADSDAAYRNRRSFMAGLTRAREKAQARFGKQAVPWMFPQQAPGRRYR